MAATRAVARALRDAINVGVVASEELRQDEPAYQPRHQDRPAPQPRQPAPSAPTPIRQAKELQDTDPAPAKWLKVLSDLQDEIHALTGAEVASPDALSVEGAKRLKADMVGKIEAAKAKKGAQ
jgi:biotin carboxyl carrier protein